MKSLAPLLLLKDFREAKQIRAGDSQYLETLKAMDKLSLLEEMVKFQEEQSSVGQLSLTLIKKGMTLFQILEERSETRQLKELSRSYLRHLRYELEARMKP
jgi:hypothetical protein